MSPCSAHTMRSSNVSLEPQHNDPHPTPPHPTPRQGDRLAIPGFDHTRTPEPNCSPFPGMHVPGRLFLGAARIKKPGIHFWVFVVARVISCRACWAGPGAPRGCSALPFCCKPSVFCFYILSRYACY